MLDIGPIHGLGALIIFLGLFFINSIFLIISAVFLLIEKRRGKRIIQQFSAKGLFISSSILTLILAFLILFTENSDDHQILKFIDLASPVFAFTAILAMIIINVKYNKHHKT